MKVDNVKETAVKEVLKPYSPDLAPKNGSPYMRKKQTKKDDTFSAELNKKQLTPAQMRQLRNQTHKQIEKMMDDSVTISQNTAVSNTSSNVSSNVNASETERATLASSMLDYSNKRRYDSYTQNANNIPEKDRPSSISVFNIIFAICGLFLIVTGFIYIPIGIIWIVIGVFMFLYSFIKK